MITRGKKVMLFLKVDTGEYKSIGFCTNHTFNSTASTVDVSHKDLADTGEGGKWQDNAIDTFSWTITSESFYANEAAGYTPNEIFELYANGTILDVKFGLAPNSETGAPTEGWSPKTSTAMLSGKAVITSFDVNAPVSENATCSITLTGKGAVKLES